MSTIKARLSCLSWRDPLDWLNCSLILLNAYLGVTMIAAGKPLGILNLLVVPVCLWLLWMTLGYRLSARRLREHAERLSRQGGTPWFPATDEERSELRESLDRKTRNPDWMR